MQDYREILKEQYTLRNQQTPSYSLRCFAKDIGLSSARLSHVLLGRYGLSKGAAESISKALNLGPELRDFFLTSVESLHARAYSERKEASHRLRKLKQKYQSVDLDSFKIVSDWFHFAILELTTTLHFESSPNAIAKRLGITPALAKEAIERLIRVGMLKRSHQGLVSTGHFFANPAGTGSEWIRKFHRQTIEKSLVALETQAPEERDYTNLMVSMHPDDLPAVRQKLKEFRNDIDALLSKRKDRTRVYSMNIQFFAVDEITPKTT